MDSRERVFLCLEHQEPDRIPRDFWASPRAYAVLRAMTGEDRESLLDVFDVDLRYIEGPGYVGPPLSPGTDIWGVKRRLVHVPTPYGEETYNEVDVSPLVHTASTDDVDAHVWPSADHFDYTMVKRQCQTIREKGRVVVFMGDRLNRVSQLKPAMYLRGVESILADFAVNPNIASAIIFKVRAFYEGYLERILDAADGLIDIVLTGDDFGQQNGSLVSPIMWDKFLSQGFARYMEIIHSYGARTMHHTCGDVRGLVGRMNQLGLDVLQSLQPEAMAQWFGEMKATYGDTLCFHGGISIQQTLPRGQPTDVAQEVKHRVAQLGASGGYILCTAHNIQADCPPENVLAMIDAFRVHGTYPSA